MRYNVVADEIMMADVAKLPEVDQIAFAHFLIDLVIDPWTDSIPYWSAFPTDDPMRRKDFGSTERRTVKVLNVFEQE